MNEHDFIEDAIRVDEKRNAKDELLKIVEENNLTIAKIDCRNYDPEDNDSDSIYYIDEEYRKEYKSLDDLDFDYDPYIEYYCYLNGIVYCYDKDNNPVWLTRYSDEYITEHWEINQLPDFYKK